VCSLPAAGEESAGVVARPGTLGVADCAIGEAMETPSAISVAVRKDANFMVGLSR
jgi:hypothetical protein